MMENREDKQERAQALKNGFKRVTAGILVAAAFIEMISVAFVKRKK